MFEILESVHSNQTLIEVQRMKIHIYRQYFNKFSEYNLSQCPNMNKVKFQLLFFFFFFTECCCYHCILIFFRHI